jgi:hypothetical protein
MGGHTNIDRTDWLNKSSSWKTWVRPPGLGAFIGEMHANILRTLRCARVVTNGAVRGLPASRAIGLQLFAGNLCVSHAYAPTSSTSGAR